MTTGYSFTDEDGDRFTASNIGEGMVKLRGLYGAKIGESVDIDFLASDIGAMIGILQQAAKDSHGND